LWGGDLGPLQEIEEVCKEYNIPLIVDAAQGFGVRYNMGQRILGDGVHGDMVCFSFQAIKHLTTGDGGAIAFRDADLCKKGAILKWFGIDREGFRTPSGEINWESDIPEIGYKFHMNNIAGAIGVAQMKDNLTARLNTYLYNDLMIQDALKDIIVRSWEGPTAAWVSTFLVNSPGEMIDFLKKKGIHSSQMHINNDIYTGFKGALRSTDLNGVREFMNTHLCLPCGWWLTSAQVQHIIDSIKEYYASKINT
jgi:dTDP-4-amino-4,6-dideoxygalactose transaminase